MSRVVIRLQPRTNGMLLLYIMSRVLRLITPMRRSARLQVLLWR